MASTKAIAMSNFAFLKAEWPELHDAATKAEGLVYPDARAACFYTRRALELAVAWLYQHDRTLTLPYQDHLSALIHEPSFGRQSARRFSPRRSSSKTWAIRPCIAPGRSVSTTR